MAISFRQHLVAAFVIGWTILSIALSGSAFAQFKPGIDLMHEKPKDPATEAYEKAVDNEYKSKLKAIPDQPQKKIDPWGNIRNSSPSPK